MFVLDKVPAHLLEPSDYTERGRLEAERNELFQDGWYAVARETQLLENGQFVTETVLGVSVLVRKSESEIRAFRNTCRHRQSALETEPSGRSSCIRCPYHGWEYHDDGKLRKVPDIKSFDAAQLKERALLGLDCRVWNGLIFVRLSSVPGLAEETPLGFPGEVSFGGESLHQIIGTDWRPFDYSERKVACNWKIIAENAVESYHVPLVHPNTFKDFRAEDQHRHVFSTSGTLYEDLLPVPAKSLPGLLNMIFRMIIVNKTGRDLKKRFWHVHVFPNKLLYFNDFFMFYAELHPLDVDQTAYRQTLLITKNLRRDPLCLLIGKALQIFLKAAIHRITSEDFRLLPNVQEGNRSALKPGVLGRREERVFHFQEWLIRKRRGSSPE